MYKEGRSRDCVSVRKCGCRSAVLLLTMVLKSLYWATMAHQVLEEYNSLTTAQTTK